MPRPMHWSPMRLISSGNSHLASYSRNPVGLTRGRRSNSGVFALRSPRGVGSMERSSVAFRFSRLVASLAKARHITIRSDLAAMTPPFGSVFHDHAAGLHLGAAQFAEKTHAEQGYA